MLASPQEVAKIRASDPEGQGPAFKQLELPLRLSSDCLLLGRVWMLVAEQCDAEQIAEHLSSDDLGNHSGFFVSVFDGSYAVSKGDILALRSGPDVRIFLSGTAKGPVTDRLFTAHARHAFYLSEHHPVTTISAAEVLLVRLVGNGLPLPARNADGALARTLLSLQEADQAKEARFVAETSAQLLARLPEAASGAIAGVLRRLRAGALFTLCRSLFGYSSALLPEAIELYRQAGEAFDQAALKAQAAACQRYARMLETLSRQSSGEEPTLPGIVDAVGVEPAIPRLAFRALRCLAIPIGSHLPRKAEQATALAFREIGSFRIADGVIRRILDDVSTLNVVPRITISEPKGRKSTRRLRVAFDREHFAMLGLPDRRHDAEGRTYSVFVQGDGWAVTPKVQWTSSGRSAEFTARSTAPSPEPLKVMIAAGAEFGTFVVPLTA